MSETEDPSRLFESSDAPDGLRDVLRSARDDVGSPAQLALLAERLGPLLAAPPPASPPPTVSAPTSAGVGTAVKLGVVGLALLAAGGGAWLLARQEPAAPPPAAALPSVAPVSLAPEPARAPLEAPPLIPAPAAAPAAASATTPLKLPARPQPPAQLSEAELLEQARAALKSGDSVRALQRANEHASRFPRGVLVQEREVLAIQALRRLGRGAEADRRAEAFARAFPGSAFARKLER